MFGFLLTRRWVLFALAVLVLGFACWRLGGWQFSRLDERRADNVIIERNLAADPVDVRAVLGVGEPVSRSKQWRTVRMRGEYDVSEQVLVRYQTRDGRAGVSVVTPLVIDGETAVLVERGWEPAPNSGSADVQVPAPPQGTVTVQGWARENQSGDSAALTPDGGQVRLISSAGFTDVLTSPLLQGYVSAAAESPSAAEPLAQGPVLPELNSGPHFFYGLQWWFFGALALGGFCYFAWVEAREGRRTG